MTRRFLLPWLLVAAFLARLGYGLAYPPREGIWLRYERPQAGSELDPDGYVALAASFADSLSLSEDGKPSAQREPGYPVALGIAFALFGKRYLTLLILNCLLSTLALWVLFSAGERLFGTCPATLAVAVCAFYPPFLYYAAQPLRESFMLLMGILSILALLAAWRRSTGAAFAAAGAINALAALTNTTFLPFGLILAPLGFLALDRLEAARSAGPRSPGWSWLRPLRWSAAYLAVFVSLYALWPLRNHRAFGTWILGSTAGAASTFYTYLIVPQQEGGTPRQSEILAKDPVTQEGAGLSPMAREQFFWRAAAARVMRDPGSYLKLVAWRLFWDQWRILPRPRTYAHSYSAIRLASLLTDGWIIPLGFLGIALARLRPPQALWPYLFLFSLSLLHALIFTMLRYRFSLMPWMILFASCALCRAWEKIKAWPRG